MSATMVNSLNQGLGQYNAHGHEPLPSGYVTSTEVANELRSRGYSIHVPPTPPPEPEPHVVMTKPRAIAIACDVSIDAYNIEHTPGHPFRCLRAFSAGCMIPEGTWNACVTYATTLANGYMSGRYAIPYWAEAFMVSGLGGAGLGFGLGGFMDWLQENPEVLGMIGAAFAAAGAALTARRVQELLKQNIPKDYLTKADLPQILAALQGQGTAGQGAAIAQGAQSATMPQWMWPVLIGGGVLGVLLIMRK